eukprot:GHVR01037602.1.p1 GENE.GHVR01037602.1~~GHVR01037602.1.p1  ORF type:complete len:109 (-),score=7.35 GHVR01037602.1:1389-1715(-)
MNNRSFICGMLSKGRFMECVVKRDNSGLKTFFPQYDLFLTEGLKYLMSTKRKCGKITSTYEMSAIENNFDENDDNYVGLVKSNFLGTIFNIFDESHHPEKTSEANNIR